MRGLRRQPAEPPADDKPALAIRTLSRVIEGSSRVQRPAVQAHLRRLRDADPDAGPARIVAQLQQRYLAAVTASGAAVGAAAAVPAIGTLVALSTVAGETVLFLEATALFVLSVAEVHGIPAGDREQRRALVLAALVGDDGRRAVRDLLGGGRTSGAWLSESTMTLPLPAMSQLNSRMLRHVVRRYAVRRSLLTLGKLLPIGFGALIGAVGNRLMGRKIVGNTAAALGPAPDRWPVPLRLLPGLPADADAAQPSA